MRILVLDLDARHGRDLRLLLEEAGHDVELTGPVLGAAGLRPAPDLVVLAGAAASSLCAAIRARDPVIPILMLTERGLALDRVAGLRAGADDCVEVPYMPTQMMARVDALHRRARRAPPLPEILEADGCMFDLSRCLAVRDGRVIALSPREAVLVRWVDRQRVRAVQRTEILEHVFGVSPNIESRSVDMAISTLRKKIERAPDRPAIIVSVKGLGYAWGAA